MVPIQDGSFHTTRSIYTTNESIGHPSILMPLLCRLAGSPGTSAHRDIPALIASPLCTGCHEGSVRCHLDNLDGNIVKISKK